MNKQDQLKMQRRGFLGTLSAAAAAMGISMVTSPLQAAEKSFSFSSPEDPDAWFGKIKGKHKAMYDLVSAEKGIFPFLFPRLFLMTNAATGTPEKDCLAMMVLRHESVCYALQDNIWAKYKFKEFFNVADLGPAFKAADAATATSTRNPFWNTSPGDFVIPGAGPVPLGIKDLMDSGVMICVCNASLSGKAAIAAMQTNGNAEAIRKEWIDSLIPGIQLVPSGVWAVGRAQEHGCTYCFAG
ncbi:MAG TPA: twin-arginine translocation signal domain-containing protein [Chitinophagaceae bacterium]|nr:twin-arginine translocation signal domain-containing protein [Chitinophagaceae bacterium]